MEQSKTRVGVMAVQSARPAIHDMLGNEYEEVWSDGAVEDMTDDVEGLIAYGCGTIVIDDSVIGDEAAEVAAIDACLSAKMAPSTPDAPGIRCVFRSATRSADDPFVYQLVGYGKVDCIVLSCVESDPADALRRAVAGRADNAGSWMLDEASLPKLNRKALRKRAQGKKGGFGLFGGKRKGAKDQAGQQRGNATEPAETPGQPAAAPATPPSPLTFSRATGPNGTAVWQIEQPEPAQAAAGQGGDAADAYAPRTVGAPRAEAEPARAVREASEEELAPKAVARAADAGAGADDARSRLLAGLVYASPETAALVAVADLEDRDGEWRLAFPRGREDAAADCREPRHIHAIAAALEGICGEQRPVSVAMAMEGAGGAGDAKRGDGGPTRDAETHAQAQAGATAPRETAAGDAARREENAPANAPREERAPEPEPKAAGEPEPEAAKKTEPEPEPKPEPKTAEPATASALDEGATKAKAGKGRPEGAKAGTAHGGEPGREPGGDARTRKPSGKKRSARPGAKARPQSELGKLHNMDEKVTPSELMASATERPTATRPDALGSGGLPTAKKKITVAGLRVGVGCTHLTLAIALELAAKKKKVCAVLMDRNEMVGIHDAIDCVRTDNGEGLRWCGVDIYYWSVEHKYAQDYDVAVIDCGVLNLDDVDAERTRAFRTSKCQIVLASGAPWDLRQIADVVNRYDREFTCDLVWVIAGASSDTVRSIRRGLQHALGERTRVIPRPERPGLFSSPKRDIAPYATMIEDIFG